MAAPTTLELKELDEFLLARALERDSPTLLFRLACEYLVSARVIRPGGRGRAGCARSRRSDQRAEFCQLVGKTADPERALAAAAGELGEALGELEEVLCAGDWPVRLDVAGDLVRPDGARRLRRPVDRDHVARSPSPPGSHCYDNGHSQLGALLAMVARKVMGVANAADYSRPWGTVDNRSHGQLMGTMRNKKRLRDQR